MACLEKKFFFFLNFSRRVRSAKPRGAGKEKKKRRRKGKKETLL